ncbi:hypothetical protein Tco_0751255 [Tanacetum coccineum]|uniref:Uncharacterized protein n=1 Tax=Tanacetum coccineum TaxID=301880 RepID=A0ABQ4Z3I9_9ASTR
MDKVISSDDDRDHTNSSMITKPELKIGDEFLKILHDNSFNGMDGSDVTDHITKVLEITEWIKIPNVDKNELRLHVFLKSLSGDAERRLNSEGTPTTWKELSDKFFHKYYPLMTKVIKGEFEKIKDIKVEDVSLTCDTQLEVFENEVNQLSRMDDDLFTYEVKVANIPCDSKMDDDLEDEADDDMRGDDEVELTDEESDDEDEIAEVFRIDTNIFDYETPLCSAFNEFNIHSQVDPDLNFEGDIMGFKTYEDYKDD